MHMGYQLEWQVLAAPIKLLCTNYDFLNQVTDKLQALNDEFTKKQKEKKDLEDSIVRCEQKRDRSERLIRGLGGERDR